MEKGSYQDLISGKMPPWVLRLVKQAGRTINTYSMIAEGDKVLLSVSGGKDSLALALALSLRKTWLPIDYSIEAVLINWQEYPIPESKLEKLKNFFSALSVPLTIKEEPMFSKGFRGKFNCYLCSRNRRRIIFQEAYDRGISLVAMGHHLDDLVETSMINEFFRGNFSTMLPVQEFFSGKLYIIRPLVQIKEHTISRLAEAYQLPVAKPVCPYNETNIRSKLKPIVKQLVHIDKLAREHVYHAHQFTCRIPRHGYADHRSSHGHGVQGKGPPSA